MLQKLLIGLIVYAVGVSMWVLVFDAVDHEMGTREPLSAEQLEIYNAARAEYLADDSITTGEIRPCIVVQHVPRAAMGNCYMRGKLDVAVTDDAKSIVDPTIKVPCDQLDDSFVCAPTS